MNSIFTLSELSLSLIAVVVDVKNVTFTLSLPQQI